MSKRVYFRVRECGNSVEEAFERAKALAVIDNDGPEGTIATKDSFILVAEPTGKPNGDDDTPAYAVDIGGGEYLFFGWA